MMMGLTRYEAMRKLQSTPNDYYKNHLQALINANWTNTTTLYEVEEEKSIGTFQFKKVNVHVNHVVASVATGLKNGDDFRKIIFQDLNHTVDRGLYYKFADNYWLATFTDSIKRLSKDILVRRCNNYLTWQSKVDGHIISYPCVIEYDAGSPKAQVEGDITTPNNSYVMIVQGNDDTRSLVANQRMVINGRTFKLAGYNNALQNSITNNKVNLLYFDIYLDETAANDNMVDSIANHEANIYELFVDYENIKQITGYSTLLKSTVTLNGDIVTRNVSWSSSNAEVVTVTPAGLMTIIGATGSAILTAQLDKNTHITKTITVTVVDTLLDTKEIIIYPLIATIQQGETLNFTAQLYINGELQNDVVDITPSRANIQSYALRRVEDNEFSLQGLKPDKQDLVLTCSSGDINKVIVIKLKSLF